MKTILARCITCILTLSLIAHPAIALAQIDTAHQSAPEFEQLDADAQRMQLAHQLMEQGYAPQVALGMVHQLTDADVVVLIANPKMVQPAGRMSDTTQAILIGGLIVAGIIILAVAGSGSVSIN